MSIDRGVILRVVNWGGKSIRSTPIRVVAGLTFVLIGAAWYGINGGQLATVFVTDPHIVTRTEAPTIEWVLVTLLSAAGVAMLTSSTGQGEIAIDPVQLFGSLWAIGSVAGLSRLGSMFEFTGPDRRCTYASCWPGIYQGAAMAAPMLMAGVSMAVTAMIGRRCALWVRVVFPAVVLIVMAVVQLLIWDRVAVPFFDGPPPSRLR